MSQPSLAPRAPPLAGPGQSPGLASLHPGARAGNGHEVLAARRSGVPARVPLLGSAPVSEKRIGLSRSPRRPGYV